MLFKASSFAALSCVKALPPVGAKWGFSTGIDGAPSGVFPPVQPEASLTLISERLLSLTLSCRVRGFLPSVPSGVISTGTGGGTKWVFPPVQPEVVPPVRAKWGYFHRHWRGTKWGFSTGAAGTSLSAII